MFEESLYILKYKNFWLTFFYHTSKLTEQCSASIFKASLFTNYRKGLARGSAYK